MNIFHPILSIFLFQFLISCNIKENKTGIVTRSDTARFVSGQALISREDPKINIEFQPDFKYAGRQSFILFENSNVEQFYFTKTDSAQKLLAFYTVQFEKYLPGIKQTYNYKIKDSIVLNTVGLLYSPVFNEPAKVLSDTLRSDVWYKYSFLASKGYSLPQEMIGHRFIRVLDSARQKEILIIYNEDLANSHTTSAELDKDEAKTELVLDALFKNAVKGFEIK